MEKERKETNTDFDLISYEKKCDRYLQEWGYVYNFNLSSFNSQIELSKLTIKSLIAVSSGAILAIIAFLETIWSDSPEIKANIIENLWWFFLSLLFSIFTSFFSYLTQLNVSVCIPGSREKTDLKKAKQEQQKIDFRQSLFFWLSIICGSISLVFLTMGFYNLLESL